MELELFQIIPSVSEEKIHPKFKLLRDNPMLEGERKIIKSWTEGFEDRDNKIIKEFQTTFHSSLWEFYLFATFKEMNCTIDFSKNRPDFIITNPTSIFVEAVVSNIKVTGRDEKERNALDILSMLNPPKLQDDFNELIDEAITRYSNAILSKYNKFTNEYLNDEWVDEQTPFVVALASYDQVNYGREFYYPLMALLYGKYYNPLKDNYENKESIKKPGTTSDIPIGLFNNDVMDNVSGILFSCTTTFGKLTSLSKSVNNSKLNMNEVLNIRHDSEFPHFKIQDVSEENPEELTDGLFYFHNPNAKNPLQNDIFKDVNTVQISVTERGLRFEGNNSPIFSRINIPKIFMPDELKKKLIQETIIRFNYI
jgi:hypothetical protein